MKTINLYPWYRGLVINRNKTTTVRLGDECARDYRTGEEVQITVGFNGQKPRLITYGVITSLQVKKISEITLEDLEGESPDSATPEMLKATLNRIYGGRLKKPVNGDDIVTIVKWRYLNKQNRQ
ncbi:hypothetical protein KEJ26_03835 [Candidatus Bathyarchaeota archaeon]|nr:hypothetical protein [Candidatus Bathyarchaeota archaeon]